MTILYNTDDNLIKSIKTLQEELIITGIKEGLGSKNTIVISQKLDLYIAKYQTNQKKNINLPK
jgi:hypothetical protein